jgi:hypothetical protein
MNLFANTHIAVIYRHRTFGEPDWLAIARREILVKASEEGLLENAAARKYSIHLSSGCAIEFIDEGEQDKQSRGRRFNAVYLYPPAEFIGEGIKRTLIQERVFVEKYALEGCVNESL